MAGKIFSQQADDVRSALQRISELLVEFTTEYQRLVRDLRELRLPLITCTIYDSIPGLDSSETAGLCFFNDTIIRTAVEHRLRLIDLRAICNEASDYSAVSPIEPSAVGGGKIARAVVQAVSEDDAHCRVIGR